MKKHLLMLIGYLIMPLFVLAQTTFVNSGGLNVGNGGVIHVAGSVKMSGEDLSVTQNGLTVLTGDFIHNADNSVFSTDYTGSPSGKLIFRGSLLQRIRTDLTAHDVRTQIGEMNRKSMFLKMPLLEVDNESSVWIMPSMGVSVQDLIFTKGNLRLKSDDIIFPIGNGMDQDASLIVHGNAFYNGGFMEIERNLYYNLGSVVGNNGFIYVGISAPLANMYFDYFSEHWLYNMQKGEYETARYKKFEPGRGYYAIIRQEPYVQNLGGVTIANRDFLFNRTYYPDFTTKWGSMIPPADNPLPQEVLSTTDVAISGGLVAGDNYLGNPYTSALDIPLMFQAWGQSWSPGETGGNIKPTVWLWSAQDESFITISPDITTTAEFEQMVIPSQQMFIIEAVTPVANFSIPASARVHNSLRFLRSGNEKYEHELLVEVNDSLRQHKARLAIGLRPWGKPEGDDPSDAAYMPVLSNKMQQLYATASDGKDLSITSLPLDTKSVDFNFVPSGYGEQAYELKVSREYSLNTETAILYDKQTDTKVNLFETQTYTFSGQQSDNPARFSILFVANQVTDMQQEEWQPKRIYYSGHILSLQYFTTEDIGQSIEVFNTSGVQVYTNVIKDIDHNTYEINLPQGIYIVKVANVVSKLNIR